MIDFQRHDIQKSLRDVYNAPVIVAFGPGEVVRVPSRVSIWRRGFVGGVVEPSSYFNPFDFEPSVWKKITDPTTALMFKFGSAKWGNNKTIEQLNNSKDFVAWNFIIEITPNPKYAIIRYNG